MMRFKLQIRQTLTYILKIILALIVNEKIRQTVELVKPHREYFPISYQH